MKYIFLLNLVTFNLKHTKVEKKCLHVCKRARGLGIHLEKVWEPVLREIGMGYVKNVFLLELKAVLVMNYIRSSNKNQRIPLSFRVLSLDKLTMKA